VSVTHRYEVSVEWTGNRGSGTSGYRDYARDHELRGEGKPTIAASSDPAFRGDPARWNPEELLVASLAQCHLLWYLHLAGAAGVVVTDYHDHPIGTMVTDATGAGQFERVVLRPVVTVAEAGMQERAQQLHAEVGAYCFIARSVSFPVEHEPITLLTEVSGASARD
jgi:organic hydroperoxide reductase OsmC/OhrA